MAPSKFLMVFNAYRPGEALERQLDTWWVEKAVVDKTTRNLHVTVSAPGVEASLLRQVEEELSQAYRVTAVLSLSSEENIVSVPAEEEAETAPDLPKEKPASPPIEDSFQKTERIRQEAMKKNTVSAGKREKREEGRQIFGKPVKKEPQPMRGLELDMGTVTVEGDVFSLDHRELKKRNLHL